MITVNNSVQGFLGPRGRKGPRGPTGNRGSSGEQGDVGPDGAVGHPVSCSSIIQSFILLMQFLKEYIRIDKECTILRQLIITYIFTDIMFHSAFTILFFVCMFSYFLLISCLLSTKFSTSLSN